VITQKLAGTDLRRRVITALLGIPIILGLLWLGSPWWDILVVSVSLACVVEFQHMFAPDSRTGLVGMFAIVLACFLSTMIGNYLPLLGILLIFFIIQMVRALRLDLPQRQMLLRHTLYASLGAIYIGLPLSLFLAIRSFDRGALWTGIAFASNWATDSAALIGGRMFGRRKLAPRISPGKTVEGALIGVLVGFIIGLLVSLTVGIPFKTALFASVAIPVLTGIGDLLESWIKRFFAVKDAGHFLPGHGGLLDRIDGMLLAAPALYIILRLFS
jgi:phosphatidate cytidylyltransferase